MSSLRLLCDVIEHPIAGKRPVGGIDADSEGIPSLGGENILKDGGVNCDSVKRIPPAFYRMMPRGHLQAMDVLINKDGAQTGKLGLYEGQFADAAINEHLFILRGKVGEIEQRFLYYALLSPKAQAKISRFISGSAQPGLNTKFVRKVDIPVPSIQEQRRIAEVLSTVDGLIEKTEALIAKHEAVHQGLAIELLGAKGGRQTKLGEVLDLIYRYPTYYGITYVDSGVAEVRGENLGSDGEMPSSPQEYRHISEETAGKFPKVRLSVGDVVMSVRGTLGKIGVVPNWLTGAVITANLIRLAPNRRLVNPGWLRHWFLSAAFKKMLFDGASSTTIATIQVPELEAMKLNLPDTKGQERVVEMLDASLAVKQDYIMERAKLAVLKSGLMADLLSGRVEVAA